MSHPTPPQPLIDDERYQRLRLRLQRIEHILDIRLDHLEVHPLRSVHTIELARMATITKRILDIEVAAAKLVQQNTDNPNTTPPHESSHQPNNDDQVADPIEEPTNNNTVPVDEQPGEFASPCDEHTPTPTPTPEDQQQAQETDSALREKRFLELLFGKQRDHDPDHDLNPKELEDLKDAIGPADLEDEDEDEDDPDNLEHEPAPQYTQYPEDLEHPIDHNQPHQTSPKNNPHHIRSVPKPAWPKAP